MLGRGVMWQGTAVMVDSLLLTCALRCKPPHRDETVLLLSSPNRSSHTHL